MIDPTYALHKFNVEFIEGPGSYILDVVVLVVTETWLQPEDGDT